MRPRFAFLAPIAALGFATLTAAALQAQVEVPSLRWRSFETEHFRIHFEPELEAWARQVAERMESVRGAVAERVGYSYPHKIDLIVEDPFNQPNGSAWPSLTYPAMRFWATPPSPTSVIGNSRGWGDILSVHEYAHLAHLLRPSRKPFSLLLGIASIVPVGPLTFAPAWVTEGYATLIEGELTGSGRPNGAMRPAILRSLALDGYLPTYAELDQVARFNGGAMRYLVGSAYLEWLQAAQGDSSLPQLWRRATARAGRKFPAAFTATFGESPEVPYGRFAADVTEKAIEVRNQLMARGLAQGELVQRWMWSVGSPDVSPDGTRIAVRRATDKDPGGILVLSLLPDTAGIRRDSVALAKRLKKDPEDLPDNRVHPRALRREALLRPVNGLPYDAPRWMPDGERILVVRSAPLADGRLRQDLFVWTVKGGSVRRITKGAGIVLADPTPDGRSAVAQRCGAGSCSLAIVDLESGAMRTLAQGSIERSYAGARVSPDGRYVASARHEAGHWTPVVIDLASGASRTLGPNDGQSRYSPAWENDSTLLVMSEASGVIEVERHPLRGGNASVAVRTLGIAGAPEVGPDGRIWWLDLHGRGWDLRVNAAGTSLPIAGAIDERQFPATRRVNAELRREFAPAPLDAARRYGAGPLGFAFLVAGSGAADGTNWAVGATFGDPVGRGTGFAYAGAAPRGNWSGARLAYTWRGLRPAIQLQGFIAEYNPSEHRSKVGLGWEPFDRKYSGAMLALEHTHHITHGSFGARLGGSLGNSENPTLGGPSRERSLLFAEMSGDLRFSPRPRSNVAFRWLANTTSGSADDADFARHVVDARLAVEVNDGGVALRARGGEASTVAPFSERFFVGGTASPFVEQILLTQRVEHLGLPFGVTGGRRFGILTAETTGAFRLYHDWIVGGDEDFGETLRVVGGELTLDIPRISVMRIPPANLRFGVNHSLNGPVRNATQAYASFSVRP